MPGMGNLPAARLSHTPHRTTCLTLGGPPPNEFSNCRRHVGLCAALWNATLRPRGNTARAAPPHDRGGARRTADAASSGPARAARTNRRMQKAFARRRDARGSMRATTCSLGTRTPGRSPGGAAPTHRDCRRWSDAVLRCQHPGQTAPGEQKNNAWQSSQRLVPRLSGQ